MAEKIETFLKKITQELLQLLELEAEIGITKDKEGVIQVQIETKEPGILIGYHGQTLTGLQRILSLITYQQKGEWVRLVVNINDYREKRQEALKRMALSVAQKVKFSGEPQTLPPMSSFERRAIHLTLAEDPEVETASEGEGRMRRIAVKPKAKDGNEE